MDLYEHPAAYELAFSYRDIVGECDFLADVARHSLGREAHSAVELAAGPALHARCLAARGWSVVAVERSAGAVAWLRREAPEVVAIRADLRSFTLPEPVDVAFCPLSGFAYLLTDDDWRQALDAAAAALVAGGLLVLELAPDDAERRTAERWTVTRDEVTVEAEAGPSVRVGADVFEWPLTLTLRAAGRTERYTGLQRQRAVGAAHAERLVRGHPAFGAVRCHGGYDLTSRYRRGTLVLVATRNDTAPGVPADGL